MRLPARKNPYTVRIMRTAFPVLYIAEADPAMAVMSSGVLDHLVEALPQARFTIVGSPDSVSLFAGVPRLDRTLILKGEGLAELTGLWNQVRGTHWGLVVDMRGTKLSGWLRRRKRAVRGDMPDGLHAVEAAARVLQLDEVPAPRLHPAPEDVAEAEALLGPAAGPLLAIGPGADWIGRLWPAERYAKVALALLGEGGPLAGGRLLIVGGAGDRDAAHTIRLAARRERVIEAQGKLSPLATVAALRRADFYLGGDSLWTQLAVAAGVPVTAVFGPSDESVRGPWGGETLRGPRSFEEFRAMDPHFNQALQHMMDLPAERVLKACMRRLIPGA